MPVPAVQAAPEGVFRRVPTEERADRLRQQTDAGHPESDTTSDLVAYLDGEPVGWCAVEPRSHYEGLVRNNRVPWQGRDEASPTTALGLSRVSSSAGDFAGAASAA